MTFRVGQKVVCVDDSGHNSSRSNLRLGEIYTVSEIIPDRFIIGAGIFLVEARHLHSDLPFYAHRFRPVVERKTQTDISVFKEILDRVSGGELTRV